IGKKTNFENEEKKLFIKEKGKFVQDPFKDELFMVIKKDQNIDIITGCSHNGIINILNTASKKIGLDKFGIITGGLHLKGKEKRSEKTMKELKKFNFKLLAVNHCTGVDEYGRLKREFGKRVKYNCVGNTEFISK
ncbi:MAG: hypothetical protein ACQERZ_09800, partial [Fusobacteriota bacterium]